MDAGADKGLLGHAKGASRAAAAAEVETGFMKLSKALVAR
jgi:hypothetical protein